MKEAFIRRKGHGFEVYGTTEEVWHMLPALLGTLRKSGIPSEDIRGVVDALLQEIDQMEAEGTEYVTDLNKKGGGNGEPLN